MRLIDGDALIKKYKKHKKTFCKNQIEFRMLSDKDKARVDELDNCIADAVNMPTIKLQISEELIERLCALPQMQDSEGQDYVQLYDVLETLRRYAVNPQQNADCAGCKLYKEMYGPDLEEQGDEQI